MSWPDQDLLVASSGSDEVYRYDSTTNLGLGVLVMAASGGVDNPQGIAIGVDGNLYVASAATNSILRYDGNTGAYLGVFVTAGSGGLSGPAGLTFGPDGNLYVTAPTLSNDDPIFRISPTGAVSPYFEHLARPQGLAFDRDGHLFVVAIYGGERGIFQIAGEGSATLAVAGENLVGLAFDERGRMVIATNNSIHRLGWTGT